MQEVTPPDVSLKSYGLTDRVKTLRENYFRAVPEICIERPRLITKYCRDKGLIDKNGDFTRDRISILDKARLYHYVLEHRNPIVLHKHAHQKGMTSFTVKEAPLFAGSTTSKYKGVPLYPEFFALILWPELWNITKRDNNPFHITDSEVRKLNYDIFPFWIKNSVLEIARKRGSGKTAPEIELFERLIFFLTSKVECLSHTIPDFSQVIKKGLRGIIDDAKNKETETSDISKKEFYQAIQLVLEGIINYSKKLAVKAKRLAEKEKDPALKKELQEIAEINSRVPEFPARTFRDGLTAIWICWTAIHLENSNLGMSLGRLDQVLYELYQKDITEGTIKIGDAIELICCFWLKIGDHVPAIPEAGEQLFGGSGSNQAITIGGITWDGKDAVNDLTYVMLRATELMKLRDPNLNARYYSGINPPEYLKRLCEVNISTGATPAIHNDKAVIRALRSNGETCAQACDYGIIGCVEPDSNGRAYGAYGAILLNLTSVLELTLFNGKHRHTGDELISLETGDPTTFRTFAQFKCAFQKQAQWLIEKAVTLNNFLGKVHQDFYPTPILSAFFEGPMDKGRDLIQGGAVLNSSGAAIIGLADVADSLSAIEKLVYEEQVVSLEYFLKAMERNFEGGEYEVLHTRLTNPDKTPKYGNECRPADANVNWIVEMLDGEFKKIPNYRGGNYRVGYWTITNHAGFGRLTKALPNGRKNKEPFASGITPVSGVTPDLTRCLNSVAGIPARYLANGVALNLKYNPEDGDKVLMLDRFAAFVEGYFDENGGQRDGGMEIQFNVISHKDLLEAKNNPENYPELLVRVSGYTAYFKDLNPQMQMEIINRTEYRLSTGRAEAFPPFSLDKEE